MPTQQRKEPEPANAVTRAARAGTSFLVVVLAYWLYALVVVPLVEPPAQLAQSEPFKAADIWRVDEQFRRRRDQLRALFPPGAWELENPKILESDRVKLLLRDYANKGDGTVEIWPCTLIVLPSDPTLDQAERIRRAVVLEAPEGAVLQFDRPFDLRRVEIGRPTSGMLRGRVTIRSGMNSPGEEDDLHLVTRNVQLYPEHIWTPHQVEFRYGPNFGRGKQLLIKLRQRDGGTGSANLQVAGVEMIEVSHLERLHLELQSPGKWTSMPGNANGWSLQRGRAVPLDIVCSGPFRFDFEQLLASFQDHVTVTHRLPDGQVDQLSCQWLSLQLARPRRGLPPSGSTHRTNPDKPAGSAIDRLQPRKLVITGDPAIVDAPGFQLQARGRHLEYDLSTRQLLVVGEGSFIRQGENQITSPRLEYQLGANGSVGEGRAAGPGWLQAVVAGDNPRVFRARWGGQLLLRPYEGRKVVSLDRGAELSLSDGGSIAAEEIHCWLFEEPTPGNTNQVKPRPDRLMARGNVQIASAQLSGQIDELRVWFEKTSPDRTPAFPASESSPLPRSQAGSERAGWPLAASRTEPLGLRAVFPLGRRVVPNTGALLRRDRRGRPVVLHPTGVADTLLDAPSTTHPRVTPAGSSSRPPATGNRTFPTGELGGSRFQLAAAQLDARVLLGENGAEPVELMLRGEVQLREQAPAPGKRPIVLAGKLVHVQHANAPNMAVTVIGSPAHVEGRGLGLTGEQINLNAETNLLWIDGPGRTDLFVDRDIQGQSAPEGTVLVVDWQKRMLFNGTTVRYEGQVSVGTGEHKIETSLLDVILRSPIHFAQLGQQAEPQVEQIACRGSVVLSSRATNRQGLTTETRRLEVIDLQLNASTGEFRAAGPGWMKLVRSGKPNLLAPRSVEKRQDPVPPAANPGGNAPVARAAPVELVSLEIRFQHAMTGNLRTRELHFQQRVRAAYGPVPSWRASLDPDRPELLGPEAVLLSCRELSVLEMPTPGAMRSLELAATGNVRVESDQFSCQAPRVTYAESKGLLVLEGNGRTPAILFRQQQPGMPASKLPADRILFWPATRQLSLDGVKAVQIR